MEVRYGLIQLYSLNRNHYDLKKIGGKSLGEEIESRKRKETSGDGFEICRAAERTEGEGGL